jgi:hypothetical protein
MKPTNQKIVLFLFSITLLFICFNHAFGDMLVLLKDGRTVNVPVNKEDVVSLTFAENLQSTGDITWNFETGNLRGWNKTGTVFNNQPTYGDNPTARNRGQASNHQGNYWIGGYENRHLPSDPPGRIQGDGPQGTLTSQPFTINSPNITFLIGGGCNINVERVELIINNQPVLQTTGKCTETMERVNWNVASYAGMTAQIRLIDASSGGWGHINFDDVRFE